MFTLTPYFPPTWTVWYCTGLTRVYVPFSKSSELGYVLGTVFHFTHLKSGSVPLMRTMQVIEALCPSWTLVFLGEPHFRIGLVRDFSVREKNPGIFRSCRLKRWAFHLTMKMVWIMSYQIPIKNGCVAVRSFKIILLFSCSKITPYYTDSARKLSKQANSK